MTRKNRVLFIGCSSGLCRANTPSRQTQSVDRDTPVFLNGLGKPPTSERVWNPGRGKKKGALGRGTRGGMESVERANVGEFDLVRNTDSR
ncbi:hypothetical protein JMJ77_0004945 [Colletotrichum scovillei]|uniref:Uncharacterized protein n=1 Tax=Colletotrichum scovillei TaxID=1209932 RepID=A0A9P7RG47_9PEZI|nr:hypothetical protein JMJ77_0004945 [Colletotrichum scovillei]KAG7076156.1 hypothetical protein JMJ76_0013424 [Colletotrichum scovillei]KAG7083323.1 hypothetical protein JMJ78_0008769 [Colletotrichum scovillei]